MAPNPIVTNKYYWQKYQYPYTSSTTTSITFKGYSNLNNNSTCTAWTWNDADDLYDPITVVTGLSPSSRHNLPDGSTLIIDEHGNYIIEDKDAKVTYRGNKNREFSPYINASDLVAQFLKSLNDLKLTKQDALNLPINLFISWLIIEAAQRDNDPIPEDVQRLENNRLIKDIKKPRCLQCNKFIKKENIRLNFPFCSLKDAQKHIEGKRLVLN